MIPGDAPGASDGFHRTREQQQHLVATLPQLACLALACVCVCVCDVCVVCFVRVRVFSIPHAFRMRPALLALVGIEGLMEVLCLCLCNTSAVRAGASRGCDGGLSG